MLDLAAYGIKYTGITPGFQAAKHNAIDAEEK